MSEVATHRWTASDGIELAWHEMGQGATREVEVEGDEAVVVVEVCPPGPLGRLGVAAATARAGPVR